MFWKNNWNVVSDSVDRRMCDVTLTSSLAKKSVSRSDFAHKKGAAFLYRLNFRLDL